MKTSNFLFAFAAILLAALPPRSQAQNNGGSGDALARERDEQTGTAITILFDNSGSMKGEKLRQAKAGFRSWLEGIPSDYKLSLITFEKGGTLQAPLGAQNRELIASKVGQTEAISNTPICACLRIARDQIEKRRREVTPYERHVVLIFTDGEENVNSRGIAGVCEDIQDLRRRFVEVVGVGFHGEGDYMNGVATRFALANNEEELKRGLAKVDAEIGSVDDLVVSPADLEALKKFAPPKVKAAASAAPAAPAPVEDTAPVPAKKGFGMGWIFVLAIAFFVLRRVTPRSNR